ncbi:MAG: sulfatase-like hydrolase/transferase, partial [Opitutaceae bacterium]
MRAYRFARAADGSPALAAWTLAAGGPAANSHGIGYGDIDGDGCEDLLLGHGWYRRPADAMQPWKLHADWTIPHASTPMLAVDLSGDGRVDLISGSGHNYGLYWDERRDDNRDGATNWRRHLIDDKLSQAHTLAWVDLDNDDRPDLVTGRRVKAHSGGDPGDNEPGALYYCVWHAAARRFVRFTIGRRRAGHRPTVASRRSRWRWLERPRGRRQERHLHRLEPREMKLRRLIVALGAALIAATAPAADSRAAATRPNILMILIDDQNDWIGALGGHRQVKTPHLDRLAARGTLFANAHCQAPLCNPSRASLLTGLRPSTTGIYGLAPGFRDVVRTKDIVTLPQTFTRAGYHTVATGKIYHPGSIPAGKQSEEFERWINPPRQTYPPRPFAEVPEPRHPAMDWGIWPARDEDAVDYKIATAAIDALRAAPADRPFFIAAGFLLPHVPCFAPQKWFDLYPADTLQLPPVREDDRDDTPRFSWYLHWRLPEPRLATLRERNEWRPLVRAYLASTSFMDAQVGRVLSALEATGRVENTFVVLLSDHGWHLGEKGITGKNTLWERSTRVPLIFVGPGVAAGARCARPAELLDIFPTLLALTGQPARADLEGHSLIPQLRKADAPREWPAITTHNQGNHSVRTERWRYIRYADGKEELYDMIRDPNEWNNLAGLAQHTWTKAELK